jgi:carbonic anhydrase
MKNMKSICPNLFALFLATFFIVSCDTKPKDAAATSQSDTTQVKPAPAEKPSARPVHWSYEGEAGPEKWGALSPVYAACGTGKSQSPINLITSKNAGATNWSMEYKTTSLRIAHHEHVDDIVDNGHTIQITVEEGSTITLNGKVFTLKQFHFHTPSEHTLDGKHFPMEVHFVHQNEDGSFAVVGVFCEEGKTKNDNFAKIIEHLPAAPGESKHVADAKLDLQVHLPKTNNAYHYKGSLTTPPCSENVDWLVLRDRISMSAEQLKAFSSRLKNNNRPAQALNDRKITIDQIK